MAMKKLLCTLMVAVIFSLGSVAFAAEPYQGYNYNSWSVSEPAPNAYEATETVSGVTAGAGDFASPQDMVYRNGELFILDSGNARVVVLDEQYRLKREYSRFIWQSEELTLNNPKGPDSLRRPPSPMRPFPRFPGCAARSPWACSLLFA